MSLTGENRPKYDIAEAGVCPLFQFVRRDGNGGASVLRLGEKPPNGSNFAMIMAIIIHYHQNVKCLLLDFTYKNGIIRV